MKIEELIIKHDNLNMRNMLYQSHKQIETAAQTAVSTGYTKEKIKNILILGMGGSAISADIFLNLYRDHMTVPYYVLRDYIPPRWVSKETLVIASSYSGNTEETLNACGQASEAGAMIAAMTNGGRLKELSMSKGYPVFGLTSGLQPRYALYSSLFTLIKIFESLKIIPDQNDFINKSATLLKNKAIKYGASDTNAVEIAQSIHKKIPVIYSAQNMTDSAGERFKGQLNENSKMMAFHKSFPEMNHNEIVGWETDLNLRKRFVPILITDDEYNPRVKKRFSLFSDILAGYEINPVEISSGESTQQLRLLDIIYLCDWISYYTAVISRKDPAEIDNIDYLKKLL